MAYAFKSVTLYSFDIHPIAALLQAPAASCFQPGFAFLGDAQQYEQQWGKGTPVPTQTFVFDPLDPYELEKSHFWKAYGTITTTGGHPDYWRLQLPFWGRVRDGGFTLNHSLPGVTITAIPSVFLTGIGWSTQLKIRVKGEIKKADLIALVGWLARGEGAGFSFTVAGGAKDRKGVFRYFNDRMFEEVFPLVTPPHPGMKIVNQFVISLNGYEGDSTPYNAMATDERALMRSILFGRSIDPVDLAKEETSRPLLKTQMSVSDMNFTLTNFDYGTLIFLQQAARRQQPPNRANKRKVECFAANAKNFLMMMHLLSQFSGLPGQPAPASDLGNRSIELAAVLAAIPKVYSNLFCQSVYKHHKALTAI
jgi:hypothetical protein